MSLQSNRLLKRCGAVTLSDEAIRGPKTRSRRRTLVESLKAFGVVTVSAETQIGDAQLEKASAASINESPASPKKRDWIDGFEVLYKFAIAIIGTVWAVHAFGVQKDNLLLQLKAQDDSNEYQRQMSQAQFAASVVPSISDDPGVRRALAMSMLSTVAPRHAVDFSRLMAGANGPPSGGGTDMLEQRELESVFSAYLADARKCQDYQLYDQAAKRYIRTWNNLPERFVITYRTDPTQQAGETAIDGDLIDSAIRSYADGDSKTAVSRFSKAFRNVVVP